MRVALLGPLTVVDDAGNPRVVAAPRQRTLLAALALRANEPVSHDALAEAAWDGAPPPGWAATLRSYLMRLRQVLGPHAARIVTHERGYLIQLDAEELDLLVFETLCHEAGASLRAGAWDQAVDAAGRAAGLWRGEPLADVPSQLLRDAYVPRLDRLWAQVQEDGIEAQLHQGGHEQVVERLRDLTGRYPLRERFHGQFMLALAGMGRRAEALAAYQDARRALVDELGIEPGPELRAVHERILAGREPPAVSRREAAATGSAGETVPRQLPAATQHFTGRAAETDAMLRAAHETESVAGAVVVCAVDGMAGIGKTALAVHVAHRLSERFPGGQLFIDLHGYTSKYTPREPGEALEWLLRALGVPEQQIPGDTEARAAFYRQRLADTRTLIVLDNAASEAQVRPLLPGGPGCLVLITSRRKLKGLDDAHSLALDLLTPTDAVALLRAVAGPGRIPAADPLAGEITELCGRLPLTLRVAGALLRHRPAWSVGDLAGLLRDQHRRISASRDGEHDLGIVFDLSYTGVSEQLRLLLRRLALAPGPDADAYAAAALLDTDPRAAAGLLEELVDHNLLLSHAPGRYRLHDLIRVHIQALVDTDPGRDAALDRLLRYYAYAAHTAQSASVHTAQRPRPGPHGPAPAHSPALAGPVEARAWLHAEHDNLQAAYTYARASAPDEHALAPAAGLAKIPLNDSRPTVAADVHVVRHVGPVSMIIRKPRFPAQVRLRRRTIATTVTAALVLAGIVSGVVVGSSTSARPPAGEHVDRSASGPSGAASSAPTGVMGSVAAAMFRPLGNARTKVVLSASGSQLTIRSPVPIDIPVGAWLPGDFCTTAVSLDVKLDPPSTQGASAGDPGPYGYAIAPQATVKDDLPYGWSLDHRWDPPGWNHDGPGFFYAPVSMIDPDWQFGPSGPAPDVRKWHHVYVFIDGDASQVEVDGKRIGDFSGGSGKCGGLLFRVWGGATAHFDHIVISHP